tara:strand:- start:2465 stop:3865 length:1401 start_codon:yes stop_codon:yes gene_type:complete
MEVDSDVDVALRLSTNIKHFICYLYTNNIVKIEKVFIGMDNLELLSINTNILATNNEAHTLYAQLLNIVNKTYNCNFVCTIFDIVNISLNTIFVYNYNLKYCILKNKSVCKKNIMNYSDFTEAITQTKSENIIIPLYKFPDTLNSLNKYLHWIKFIKDTWNPIRICISICFDIYTTNTYKKIFIDGIKTLNNQNNSNSKGSNHTFIFIETLITQSSFIYNLKGTIDDSLYDNIMLFHNKPHDTIKINLLERHSQNELYNYYKELSIQKQSRLCIDLQSITNLEELIKYCNLLGPYIVAIKINSNYIFNENLLKGLQKLSQHHQFIIIDDKRLVLNKLDDIKVLTHIYKYVDAISISLNFMNEKIEELLNNFIKINKYASIIFYFNNDLHLITKQTNYFNKYTFGISGYEKLDNNLISLINYKNLKNLGDNFLTMKHTDMIVLGNELYKETNPIDIVKKLNAICFTK